MRSTSWGTLDLGPNGWPLVCCSVLPDSWGVTGKSALAVRLSGRLCCMVWFAGID